jgi:uncharacterized protein DUF4386
MTRTTNSRLAGVAFLFYIVVGISSMMLSSGASRGDTVPARLASVAAHAPQMRATIILNLLGNFSALVLGVTLYGITREQDNELAVFAMMCRVCEGLSGAIILRESVTLLKLAAVPASDTVLASAGVLFMPNAPMGIGATFFAVGSTIFSYLLLRGRMVPVPIAWLGVLSSALLVVLLPLQFIGVVSGIVTSFLVMWMPALVFELTLAGWLLVKGAAPAQNRLEVRAAV